MKNQYFGDKRDLFKYDLLLDVIEAFQPPLALTFIPMLTANDPTALVRRYAHLSSAHLQGVVEKVAAFGKPAISEGQDGQGSGATVTKTGKRESVAAGSGTQVVEKVGAGDGI